MKEYTFTLTAVVYAADQDTAWEDYTLLLTQRRYVRDLTVVTAIDLPAAADWTPPHGIERPS